MGVSHSKLGRLRNDFLQGIKEILQPVEPGKRRGKCYCIAELLGLLVPQYLRLSGKTG